MNMSCLGGWYCVTQCSVLSKTVGYFFLQQRAITPSDSIKASQQTEICLGGVRLMSLGPAESFS